MKVKVPMLPWKGDKQCDLEDASIGVVLDYKHPDSLNYVHHIVIGDVDIFCQGFSIGVETQDVFLICRVHNIEESSWDAYMEAYSSDCWMEGSGRLAWDTEKDEQSAEWWAGCDLLVPVTEVEFEVGIELASSV